MGLICSPSYCRNQLNPWSLVSANDHNKIIRQPENTEVSGSESLLEEPWQGRVVL